jgi:dTDP-L-rhamnose 4-epimerase
MYSVILRFQNVFGPGQSLRNPYTGIISIFFNKARQGLEIPVYEDGFESRDFVYIDDVVEALVRSLNSDLPTGQTLNIGSGVATPVIELARLLNEAAELDALTKITGQFRVGDIRHCFADISLASKLLGWVPQTSLLDGLTQFVKWAYKEPAYVDQSGKAEDELSRNGLAGGRGG